MTKRDRTKNKTPSQTRHGLPQTGYELIARCVPGLRDAARLTARIARERLPRADATVHPSALPDYASACEFLRAFARREYRRLEGPRELAREAAMNMGDLVGAHLCYAINHELHRRKVFWVDEALVYMLAHTDLDIQGACLKLPFPSFCVMLVDPLTLELASDVLDSAGNCEIAGQPLESLSAYVTQVDDADPDQISIRISFLFKSTQNPWPYLIARDLLFGPGDTLAEILRSHADDASPDALFDEEAVVELVHLIINVILYSTSAQFEGRTLKPPKQRERNKRQAGVASHSSLEVVHLPGKIDISALRGAETNGETEGTALIAKRFMVRGHWRRANSNWEDQRLRWIEPYWKGPDLATIIEQEYRVRL